MANLDKPIEKTIEIQNRFSDIRTQIKDITESILTMTEMMGVAFDQVYELESMLEEMEEKEPNEIKAYGLDEPDPNLK